MKRVLPVACVCVIAAGLLACAALPEMEEEGDSLVIGSLILDFPEGLYDPIPRKVDMNVRVTFRNVTRNERFHVYTKRGYFYFPTNGTDEYILESFRMLKTQVEDTGHSFSGQQVHLKIVNSPSRVIYLGHINATYFAPRPVRDKRTIGRFRYYCYPATVAVEWDQDLLRRDMARRQPDSRWLDLEIAEYGRNGRAQWQQPAFMERRSHPSFLPQM